MDTNAALIELAQKVAALRPATKDFNPGIGAGMLNALIADAAFILRRMQEAK